MLHFTGSTSQVSRSFSLIGSKTRAVEKSQPAMTKVTVLQCLRPIVIMDVSPPYWAKPRRLPSVYWCDLLEGILGVCGRVDIRGGIDSE